MKLPRHKAALAIAPVLLGAVWACNVSTVALPGPPADATAGDATADASRSCAPVVDGGCEWIGSPYPPYGDGRPCACAEECPPEAPHCCMQFGPYRSVISGLGCVADLSVDYFHCLTPGSGACPSLICNVGIPPLQCPPDRPYCCTMKLDFAPERMCEPYGEGLNCTGP